jgi:uncharacterized membrane protein YbhN (UPF0104 family)
LVWVVVILAGLFAVGSQSRILAGAGRRLSRLYVWWVLAALAAEVVSYVASAELQRRLLAAAGVRVGRLFLVALSYASSAVSALLPAGAAIGAGYTHRRLARSGVGSAVIVWVLVASGVVSTAALVGLGLAGAELQGVGLSHSTLGWLSGVLIGVGAVGLVVMLAWASRQREWLERIGDLVVRGATRSVDVFLRRSSRGRVPRRLFPREGGEPVTIGTVGWMGLCAVAAGNWAADGAVLGLSFVALGFGVPWQGLLLAYVVTQIATSLPFLGCIGLVEASLTLALVCVGVHADRALAAVLVYRLVSFWSVLPVGWIAWGWLKRHDNQALVPSPARPEPLLTAA